MPSKRKVKVGDTVEIDAPSGYVRLPGGVVVTCRDRYTFQHEGEHRIGNLVFDAVKAEDD